MDLIQKNREDFVRLVLQENMQAMETLISGNPKDTASLMGKNPVASTAMITSKSTTTTEALKVFIGKTPCDTMALLKKNPQDTAKLIQECRDSFVGIQGTPPKSFIATLKPSPLGRQTLARGSWRFAGPCKELGQFFEAHIRIKIERCG